ncbi:hypothetical protein [Candidatus Ichthyocystis sparus]|nr:hypothetical protein [Candidatus Ichthyocystis sparus]
MSPSITLLPTADDRNNLDCCENEIIDTDCNDIGVGNVGIEEVAIDIDEIIKRTEAAEALVLLSECPKKMDTYQQEAYCQPKDMEIDLECISNLLKLSCDDYEVKVDIDLIPEEVNSSFFSLKLLFGRLAKAYRKQLVVLLLEKNKYKNYELNIVNNVINSTLHDCIYNILYINVGDEFIKCFNIVPGLNFHSIKDNFLSKSDINLLKSELEGIIFSERITEIIGKFDVSKVSAIDFEETVSLLVSDIFNKCVVIFMELVTSIAFFKKLFFRRVSWFDMEIFSSVTQIISSFNRKFFCQISFLENRYLSSTIIGARTKSKYFMDINTDIPGFFELLDLHIKNLDLLVTDTFSKEVPVLRSDGTIAFVGTSIVPELMKKIVSSLYEDVRHRIYYGKRVLKRKCKMDKCLLPSNLSSIDSSMFYKSLRSIIDDGNNYIGNGFRYYVMKIFAPICMSVAYDIRDMMSGYFVNKVSDRSFFILESNVRASLFDFVFSSLSDIGFLSVIDNAINEVSPHIGMNLHEISEKIFRGNMINRVKSYVNRSINFSVLRGILPKKILLLSRASKVSKSKYLYFKNSKIVSKIIRKSVYSFHEKVRSYVIDRVFLDFYIMNTVFTKFDDFDLSVSNVEISKINSVKLDFLCKIIEENDRLEYEKRILCEAPDYKSSIDVSILDKLIPWLDDQLRAIITRSTLVMGSNGVVLELGESIDKLLEAISGSIVNECARTAVDVVSVDRGVVSIYKSKLE